MHEVTNGPFDRRLTEYAPFAPDEQNPKLIKDYEQRLSLQLVAYD